METLQRMEQHLQSVATYEAMLNAVACVVELVQEKHPNFQSIARFYNVTNGQEERRNAPSDFQLAITAAAYFPTDDVLFDATRTLAAAIHAHVDKRSRGEQRALDSLPRLSAELGSTQSRYGQNCVRLLSAIETLPPMVCDPSTCCFCAYPMRNRRRGDSPQSTVCCREMAHVRCIGLWNATAKRGGVTRCPLCLRAPGCYDVPCSPPQHSDDELGF